MIYKNNTELTNETLADLMKKLREDQRVLLTAILVNADRELTANDTLYILDKVKSQLKRMENHYSGGTATRNLREE